MMIVRAECAACGWSVEGASGSPQAHREVGAALREHTCRRPDAAPASTDVARLQGETVAMLAEAVRVKAQHENGSQWRCTACGALSPALRPAGWDICAHCGEWNEWDDWDELAAAPAPIQAEDPARLAPRARPMQPTEDDA
jgi:hypothetical protein